MVDFNNQYTLDDVLNLYEKHIFPINKVKKFRYKSHEKQMIAYVENICLALDLTFFSDSDCITFGADVYSVIKEYYTNQALFFRGDLLFVSFQEALNIIGNGISPGTYLTRLKQDNQVVNDINKKRRENWINFTKNLTIKFFYRNKFYFLRTEVEQFAEGIISTKSFHTLLVNQYNCYVTLERLRMFLSEKYSNRAIRYLGAEYFYPKSILKEVSEYFPYEDGYLTSSEVCKILNIKSGFLIKCVREKNCFPGAIKQESYHQFPIEEVERWKKFYDENRDLYDFVAELVKRKKDNVKKPYSDDFDVVQFVQFLLEVEEDYNFKLIQGEDKPFPNSIRFVNKNHYQEIERLFENYWTEKGLIKTEGKLGKFKILANKIKNPNAPTTMNDFYHFSVRRISTVKGITAQMMLALYEALAQIEKELIEHNDEEVEGLLEKVKQIATNKSSIQDFCMFLTLLQNKYQANFINSYKYNKHEVIETEREDPPYSEEQYFRFGFLLINDTHQWHDSYLEKALSKRVYASLWLYGLLHYVCAWRSIDMIKKLPFPTLKMDAKEFLNIVKEKNFTEQMANNIVNEVETKVRYLQLKPSKTQKKKPPALVLEIPESIKFRLGMLLGICEAHRQLVNGDKLVVHDIKKKATQIEFFGKEFLDIFHGDGFNNLRAVKTFENLMAYRADDEKIGTGYIIASISRSHKCTLDQKSNTTAIYLANFRSLTDGDILIRELFERGVCSFVPYLILKMIDGIEMVQNMTYFQQTKRMKELVTFHPYDAEMLINLSDEVLERARVDALALLNDYGCNFQLSEKENEMSKKAIYSFINRIACGTAPAKEKNINCISVAKGIGCVFPGRESCIGCGQELYLKSSFFIIGQRMRELIKKEENSETHSEKQKYQMLIDKLFKPVLTEMIMVLKEVYDVEDISEFRDMVFGIKNTLSEVK